MKDKTKGMIKMLTILITPTMITFKNLTDEMQEKLNKEYPLEVNKKGEIAIRGDEVKLYKALLNLSYTYDIEIV